MYIYVKVKRKLRGAQLYLFNLSEKEWYLQKIRLIGLKQVLKKGRPTQSESVSCNLQSGVAEAGRRVELLATPVHRPATTPLNAEASLVFHTGNDDEP